ncbi:hypothetical protein BDV38DRAFT_207625 [Aspergillus pseudotamarii]|uniref:Uncharacterized protein n=1 Tax=Aspergillus pseudotamarii TaxID=132259 RepID=A0A5N6SCZ8_ASPPS|nr:uncharacterized protein BDV38DRAFT_207625 [Aspergillus pseudotamarii]KAE8132596.1 hypothetical protein BDV38DRAFT_207625 [Aspergillus pseudotamarii]
MFDLPNAKRVRRNEILSPSSSRSPSPQPEDTLTSGYERLGALLNLDSLIQPEQQPEQTDTQATNGKDEEDEEQEFEFRLFSAPVRDSTAAATQDTGSAATEEKRNDIGAAGTQKLRIRLRSPTPGARGPDDGGFVKPFRGWEYYFSTPGLLSGSKEDDPKRALRRKQFEEAAVSGEQMGEWAKVPWPGCHLPWRVIHWKRHQTKLPREDTSTAVFIAGPQIRDPKSRKKPGKKRRLQLRKRLAVAERAKETDAEKRNRKNREKKIKRRQKAREMKAAAAAASGQRQDTPAIEEDDASSQESD